MNKSYKLLCIVETMFTSSCVTRALPYEILKI